MSAYTYHLDEGAIQLPDGFHDASINVFEWTGNSGRITLTMQREKYVENQTFEELVHRATSSYAKVFANYAEEDPMEIAMDVPTLSKRFRWRQDTGVSYHHQVFLDLRPKVLVITVTGAAAGREQVDQILHDTLRSLQLRERA